MILHLPPALLYHAETQGQGQIREGKTGNAKGKMLLGTKPKSMNHGTSATLAPLIQVDRYRRDKSGREMDTNDR